MDFTPFKYINPVDTRRHYNPITYTAVFDNRLLHPSECVPPSDFVHVLLHVDYQMGLEALKDVYNVFHECVIFTIEEKVDLLDVDLVGAKNSFIIYAAVANSDIERCTTEKPRWLLSIVYHADKLRVV